MVVEKVALCITNYNRVGMLFAAFDKVLDDTRISMVHISDDCSNDEIWHQIGNEVNRLNRELPHPKILLHRNGSNVGCYHNKAISLGYQCRDEYAILLDSDNVIDTSYLDALFRVPEIYWDGHTILAPEYARPAFNYLRFSGSFISKENIKPKLIDMHRTQFDCLINCANYVVPVKEYLRVFDPDFNPWTCDTVYQLYNWLKAGNGMYVVPGMQYDHLIHDGSHYKEHNEKVPGLFKEITNKIMQL